MANNEEHDNLDAEPGWDQPFSSAELYKNFSIDRTWEQMNLGTVLSWVKKKGKGENM